MTQEEKQHKDDDVQTDTASQEVKEPTQPTEPTEPTGTTESTESVQLASQKSAKMVFIIIAIVLFGVMSAGAAGYYFFVHKNNTGKMSSFLQKGDKTEKTTKKMGGEQECAVAYEELLEANAFDFDAHCVSQDVRSGQYEGKLPQKKTHHMVLIFDASGSMAGQIDGKTKFDIAKDAAKKFIDQVAGDDSFALSIVVYGHKGSNSAAHKKTSCDGIEEVYYLGPVEPNVAKRKLDSFKATGWTPIARSFEMAADILNEKPADENYIFLVSDGKETCDGDPIAVAKKLNTGNLHVTANVVGFDVGGADEAQLKDIAAAGGGDYFSVKSQAELEAAFAKHKEMLNEANFVIGRTIDQLYDMSLIKNTYINCLAMLKKEETSMMLDIHTSKLAGEGCEKYADDQYHVRFDKYKQMIEEHYRDNMETFEQLR